MHAATTTTKNQHQHKINRAMARLDEIEAMVPGLQHDMLVTAAWIEFSERGKRLDS